MQVGWKPRFGKLGGCMSLRTLHYIYDPLCGWCYGAAPLLRAAAEQDGLQIELHAGGMMMGPRRQPVTPALRQFVLPHDRRIAELSGQTFGAAYQDGLLNDTGAVFDSEPPITAVLAADSMGLAMLERIQWAHFIEGRRIAEREVLESLAADIGLDGVHFAAAFDLHSGPATQKHVQQSRDLLHAMGGVGFPTFVFEFEGTWRVVDSSLYLGHVPEWIEALKKLPE